MQDISGAACAHDGGLIRLDQAERDVLVAALDITLGSPDIADLLAVPGADRVLFGLRALLKHGDPSLSLQLPSMPLGNGIDLAHWLSYRTLAAPVTVAMERRLRAHIDRVNTDLQQVGDGDVLDAGDDEDLMCTLIGCADHGLDVAEQAHGFVARVDGTLRPYQPPPVFVRVRRRVRAWKRRRSQR